jgi:hypothetical protein
MFVQQPQAVLQEDVLSWQNAANETSLVLYCFLVSSIIPHKCGSGKDATIKIKTAMTLQVVLRDDDSSRQ